MIRSMTGYGRGEAVWNGHAITAEVRSVNNRYLDCTIKLPRVYSFAEDALKSAVQKRVNRGKVEVFFSVGPSENGGISISVNRPVADGYYKAMRELADTYSLADDISVSLLSRFPDVFLVEKAEEDREEAVQGLLEALNQALDEFNAMREREGAKLAEDVRGRAGTIADLTGKVEERAPGIVADYRARLTAKLQEVLSSTQIDESRILTEAAIYADKVAVDEETVRLRSHLSQLNEMLDRGGSVGRKLDFLIQEFNREANTIGSKCNDVETARIVVEIKAEIEKIREQIQNIE
ncbi:MAG: YicC family protein [Clostridiales bacterium]|nr:YicC family protein [Clostridiales bacterium]